MIDPFNAGLIAVSIGSAAAAIGTVIWGASWRSLANDFCKDARGAEIAADIAIANRQHWRDTAGRLAKHNLELTEQLRAANGAINDVEAIALTLNHKPAPSWQRPRDAKGHFIKSNQAGAATAG